MPTAWKEVPHSRWQEVCKLPSDENLTLNAIQKMATLTGQPISVFEKLPIAKLRQCLDAYIKLQQTPIDQTPLPFFEFKGRTYRAKLTTTWQMINIDRYKAFIENKPELIIDILANLYLPEPKRKKWKPWAKEPNPASDVLLSKEALSQMDYETITRLSFFLRIQPENYTNIMRFSLDAVRRKFKNELLNLIASHSGGWFTRWVLNFTLLSISYKK